jgi:hypothetical protein
MSHNKKPVVLSFFEFTGTILEPWAKAGYQCYAFDIQHGGPVRDSYGRPDEGFIEFRHWDASQGRQDTCAMLCELIGMGRKVAMVFGFPPCTDLAASGARHWEAKRKADPEFQNRAVAWAKDVAHVARWFGAPYMIENPQGALSTLWRKPDHRFDPCDYGGYIPLEEAQHPRWPEYIPPQDAYTKRTCLWTSSTFFMPDRASVEPVVLSYTREDGSVTTGSPQWGKLGGKSMKTKNIRSATPRGFARAVFFANAKQGA